MNDIFEAKNFLDRTIEAIAPAWATSRYESRARLATYRGAIGTRTGQSWGQSTSFKNGSTADRRGLGTMRDRARRAYRENVIAKSLLDCETDQICPGTFSLQMLTSSPAFNEEASPRYDKWLDRADVTGKMSGDDLYRATWRETRKDGDGGVVMTKVKGYPQLQYIPGDLIMNPRGGYDYRTMFDGVECDPSGKPVRFWIRDVDEVGTDDITSIAADDFVYLPHLNDPMAARGMTVFAPVFRELDGLDGYKESVIIAARMACMFGLIEKRKNPGAVTNGLGSLLNSHGDQQKAITLENGMLKVIGSEDSVMQVQAQQPMNQTPDFIRAMMRIICMAFDMPLEIGSRDLSQVNFSGGRIGLLNYYRGCRAKQDWLKSRCWNRITRWWLSVERKRQLLGFDDAFKTPFPDDFLEFELHGREYEANDPKAEADADLLEISAGMKSLPQACEERGRDWRQIAKQNQEFRTLAGGMSIPLVLSSATRDEIVKHEALNVTPPAIAPAA